MKRAYHMIVPMALALVSACSILPKPDPSDVYRLASAQPASQGTPVSWSLRVTKPQTSEFLDSPRIAVVPDGNLISNYANSRWSDPVEVVIRLDARLVRGRDQRIIASRRFEVRQPMSDAKVPAVVAAFGQAGDQLNKQVVDWVVSQGNTALKP